MNLLIDIGNSSIKAGLSKKNLIKKSVKIFIYEKNKFTEDFNKFLKSFKEENKINILDSAGVSLVDIKLKKSCLRIIKNIFGIEPYFVSSVSNIPIKLEYGKTLGSDRICSAAAANSRYSGRNILVIDFGTATTYNIISNNTFRGGIISPGIKTALNSLIRNTALPYPNKIRNYKLISQDTGTAIASGVYLGVKYTVEGIIKNLKRKYDNLIVIATGGMSGSMENLIKGINYFEKHLVLEGISIILNQNKIARQR